MTSRQIERRYPRYGIDGGLNAIVGLVAVGAVGLVLAGLAVADATTGRFMRAAVELLGGLILLQVIPSYLYSTTSGKLRVWTQLLADQHLRGDERILDMGCGRGAVLCTAAKLVPSGTAVGLDLWKASDQTGNSIEAARRNLEAEGVNDRCQLQTGDMTALPFPDASFDLVVSSLAIHNVASRRARLQAVDEALRVLKPGGRVLIADLMFTRSYAQHLRERRVEARVSSLGWRFWFGVLGLATGLVTGTKPATS